MDIPTLATVLPTAISATLYTLVQSSFVWSLSRRRPAPAPSVRPWVSILKPVAGADDELRENLESFAALDYPAFEIVLGVASPDDPAVPVVQAFIAAHPDLAARLVWTTPPRGEVKNPKVAQLIDLTRAARGSVIVVSDANVRVPRGYLASIVSCLLRPGVGLVSSVITGTGERTFGAALENAQLGAGVAPAVVVAHRIFGRPITVGKSMAMRRADLDRVGGWESVAGVLAEDDVLGQKFHALGYGVELCLDPVENRNVSCSALRSVDRHARWAKMRRAIVPSLLFVAEPLISPFIVSLLVAFFAASTLSYQLVALALGLQFVGALLAHTVASARRPLLLAALEPVRALAWLACWVLAGVSRRVSWRGNTFVIGEGSRLVPVQSARARIAGARALG
ncbi:MAG: glycosyltransferase [Minicystis sp.]